MLSFSSGQHALRNLLELPDWLLGNTVESQLIDKLDMTTEIPVLTPPPALVGPKPTNLGDSSGASASSAEDALSGKCLPSAPKDLPHWENSARSPVSILAEKHDFTRQVLDRLPLSFQALLILPFKRQCVQAFLREFGRNGISTA